jgi:hypothetical protein
MRAAVRCSMCDLYIHVCTLYSIFFPHNKIAKMAFIIQKIHIVNAMLCFSGTKFCNFLYLFTQNCVCLHICFC